MSSLSRELVFLILQFLDEEKFKETVHKLEQESGFFFNMKYFEDQVQAGEWEEVERYLSGFTKVEDNCYSMKIFFEIRKQKYLEALDRQDRAKAVEILVRDLMVFASFNEDLFKEITQLSTLDNYRQNEKLSKYGDTKSARNIMLIELKKLIEANPLFRDKHAFPAFKASRLRTLINQSLDRQHQLCKNPRPNPDIKTLFTDHTCASSNGTRGLPPANNPLAGPVPKPGVFPPLGGHGPFLPVVSPSPSAIAGWMSSANMSIPHAAVVAAPPGLVQAPSSAAFLKHPRAPGGHGMDYQTVDSSRCSSQPSISIIKKKTEGHSSSTNPSKLPQSLHIQEEAVEEVVADLGKEPVVGTKELAVVAFSGKDKWKAHVSTEELSPELPIAIDIMIVGIQSSLHSLMSSVSEVKSTQLLHTLSLDSLKDQTMKDLKKVTNDISALIDIVVELKKEIVTVPILFKVQEMLSTQIDFVHTSLSKKIDLVQDQLADLASQVSSAFRLFSKMAGIDKKGKEQEQKSQGHLKKRIEPEGKTDQGSAEKKAKK